MRNFRGNDLAMIFQEPLTSLNPLLTVFNTLTTALINIDDAPINFRYVT